MSPDLPDRYSVHCGDTLSLLRTVRTASVDAILTDPPYLNTGTGASRVVRSGGVPDERQFFDSWMENVWAALARVLKPTGALWMTIDWRGALSCEQAATRCDLDFAGVGVWHRAGLGMGFVLRHVYECFVVGRMPDWQRTLTNEPDVWTIPWAPGNRQYGHEAEKPVELGTRALKLLAPPADALILDPFCGSGSFGVAALQAGYRFQGFDREERYVEIARRRLGGSEVGQGRLFAAPEAPPAYLSAELGSAV